MGTFLAQHGERGRVRLSPKGRKIRGIDVLTGREQDVVVLLYEGLTYEDVGLALGITTGTVRTHVENAYRKLNVVSARQLHLVPGIRRTAEARHPMNCGGETAS